MNNTMLVGMILKMGNDVWISDLVECALMEGSAESREEVVAALIRAHSEGEVRMRRRDLAVPGEREMRLASEVRGLAGATWHKVEAL